MWPYDEHEAEWLNEPATLPPPPPREETEDGGEFVPC